MKPTTAVIFAAGSGTRLLPITSAVQKELLPILNRPVVDYIVSDLIAAGIKRIIFIIRPGQTGLKDFYLGSSEYEGTLERLGKTADLKKLTAILLVLFIGVLAYYYGSQKKTTHEKPAIIEETIIDSKTNKDIVTAAELKANSQHIISKKDSTKKELTDETTLLINGRNNIIDDKNLI